MRKLLVIGLDGYEATVADRLRGEGRLPALDALFRRAARVALEHGAARRTGLAWEHFATGLSPEEARRWSAVAFDAEHYRCLQQPTALAPFTAALDCPSVVFDAPYFDLARTPRTRGIVSWGAHDPGTALRARPKRLADEIHERFGAYTATPWIYGYTWPSADRTREMGEALVAGVRQRARVAQWLLTERLPEWQLGIVVVSELHSAAEALWHGVDVGHPLHALPSAAPARSALEATYAAVDALVGALVSCCADADVLVFSMHGMGPNDSDLTSMALLPELLYRRQLGRSLLRPARPDPQSPLGIALPGEREDWSQAMERLFARPRRSDASHRGAARRLWHALPASLRSAVARRAVGGTRAVTKRMSWMPAVWYAEDWPRMQAFALPSFYDGQVRVNLEGRESRGRVPLARYDEACKRVEEDVHACTDPATGRGVVREVLRNPRADPRELTATEADLLVVWEGTPMAFSHPQLGSIGPLPYRRPGGHTGGAGIAWLAGAGVAPGFHGMRRSLDVVPTIVDHVTGRPPLDRSGRSFRRDVLAPRR